MKNSKHISENIRESFRGFFKNQNHVEVPSSSLIILFLLSAVSSVNSSIFGTSKFFKEQISKSNEDIYLDIEKALVKQTSLFIDQWYRDNPFSQF